MTFSTLDKMEYDPVSHLTDYDLDMEIVFAKAALDMNDGWLTLGWLVHLNNEKMKRNMEDK